MPHSNIAFTYLRPVLNSSDHLYYCEAWLELSGTIGAVLQSARSSAVGILVGTDDWSNRSNAFANVVLNESPSCRTFCVTLLPSASSTRSGVATSSCGPGLPAGEPRLCGVGQVGSGSGLWLGVEMGLSELPNGNCTVAAFPEGGGTCCACFLHGGSGAFVRFH